jgi:hypothetical protein
VKLIGVDIEKCRTPIGFFVSLAFLVDVLYNAITIKIIRPKAEPFQNVEDGHIVSISIAGFFHTLKGTGQILFHRKGEKRDGNRAY